jgi:hypothetical protein
MKKFLGHGYRLNASSAVFVGHIPGRKSVALYAVEGSVLEALAYFPTQEQARKALRMIDKLANAHGVETDQP